MPLTADPTRLLVAAGIVLAYLALCLAVVVKKRRRVAPVRESEPDEGTNWLVAFASQTGTAEHLAAQTAHALQSAGLPTRLCPLADIDAEQLRHTERLLLVVSTYGEGDAPDSATRFVERCLGKEIALGQLRYAVLALGDSGYASFCGFGRRLDAWLRGQGAQPIFERIEADRCHPDALAAWRQNIARLAGGKETSEWHGPAYSDWRLVERRLLNPGSVGEPVYHLEFEPADGNSLPDWHSGDLVQVLAPADQERARTYSIASIPADNRIHLLVRLRRRPDGRAGLVSGWLSGQAALGETIKMRLCPHQPFRLGGNAQRPLILIGNGTGLAGLRSHLRARAHAGHGSAWLFFGERHAAHDAFYRDELEAWRDAGILERLDLVFSRDQAHRAYVQDRLHEMGEDLRDWVRQGAAIYVCGSRQGMAAGVDAALTALLGKPVMEQLALAGRYCRDVY